MPSYQKYNIDHEIYKGLVLVDEALDFVADYKFALALGTSLTDVFHILHLIHPFDPLRTVGKY
jgi:hypothetical protein